MTRASAPPVSGRRGAATLAVLLAALAIAACTMGPRFGDPIDGVECTPPGERPIIVSTVTELWLVSDGRRMPVATSALGEGGSCHYWVHTSDKPGLVHVDAPVPVAPTLETFLQIWERSGFPPGDVAGPDAWREAATNGRIVQDGAVVPGGPRAAPLRDGSVIELFAPD